MFSDFYINQYGKLPVYVVVFIGTGRLEDLCNFQVTNRSAPECGEFTNRVPCLLLVAWESKNDS
jgi:hypothetical protein